MKAVVKTFSGVGDTTLLEYDTETANMDEVNAVVEQYEKQLGGQAFNGDTGERIDRITPDVRETLLVRNIVGG